ncbi:CAP-Gly domain-containing linker protein 1 [Synchiropus splendidus]|uniref:CAP-Gly domain-containing linker protein 1 n=1 Tax=Synchiropus splendidus TaxID=270530 RepID=UPI00237EAA50|nr:CAP-Gly domain-containing linker protein 1 [Synchiropus splendidus]
MDDLESSDSSSELEPLMIQEEDGHASRPQTEEMGTINTDYSEFCFSAAQLKQSALMRPYLQEMDNLLKSCEELTGFTMATKYNDTTLSVTPSTDKIIKASDGEASVLTNYLSTNYIDTRTENASQKTNMPLTSAGNKLSDNLMEYEGQLLGMLAMLDDSMEETGVDLERQVWATGQEYVHISKMLQSCMDHQLNTELYEAEDTELYEAEEMSQNDTIISPICETDLGSEMSVALMPVERREHQLELSKGMKQTCGDVMEESEAGAEILSKSESLFKLASNLDELTALGNDFGEHIEQVQCLEKQRRDLLTELLKLLDQQETQSGEEEINMEGEETEEQISNKVDALLTSMKKVEAVSREEKKRTRLILREERSKAEQSVWKVILERQALQEELRKLKKRLFTMAWECAQSQATLRRQQSQMELLHKEEDKLHSLLLQLTEESSQLRSAHQQQLLKLQEQLQITSQTCRTQEEMTEYKRHSCGDIQQYLSGGLHALEERYEPILMALLKRREATSGALVKAKEQAQQLKVQVRPLKEEVQKLEFHRVCLEEKLKLCSLQRREELGQYKEMVTCLEEKSRELKTELMIQRRKRQDIEEIKESLTRQLLVYRAADGDHNALDHNEET